MPNENDIIIDEEYVNDLENTSQKEQKTKVKQTTSNNDNIILKKATWIIYLMYFINILFLSLILMLILVKLIQYKGFEKIGFIILPIGIIYEMYKITQTMHIKSYDMFIFRDGDFGAFRGNKKNGYPYQKIHKAILDTHKYTRLGMFKHLKIKISQYDSYDIIFKVNYDDTDILERIRFRLAQNQIKLE